MTRQRIQNRARWNAEGHIPITPSDVSLIQSPGRVDPFTWLKDVLSRIAAHPITRLAELGYATGETGRAMDLSCPHPQTQVDCVLPLSCGHSMGEFVPQLSLFPCASYGHSNGNAGIVSGGFTNSTSSVIQPRPLIDRNVQMPPHFCVNRNTRSPWPSAVNILEPCRRFILARRGALELSGTAQRARRVSEETRLPDRAGRADQEHFPCIPKCKAPSSPATSL